MKKQWNILAGNNRGSGILVVLISMVCVGLMGASLLFMSYTAIRLKATERQASKDFYSAETAMDEIRAGIQTDVSEAIASSYKYVLETYGDSEDIENRFETRFFVDLQNTGLFESGGNNYKVATLENYVSNLADSENANAPGVRVRSAAPRVTKVIKDSEIINLVLNGIEVEYKAPNGYTTKISTDISVGMPKFVYTATATSFAGLPQHALIAKEALNQTEGQNFEIDISGSAYAGSMNLSGSGNQMTITKGTLVCADVAQVSGTTAAGRLVTTDTAKFWANRIVVGGGSSVNLSGETRVLDDLELAGAKSQATLSGIYYGFGDGTVDENNAKDYVVNEDDTLTLVKESRRSSAILVNGRNSKLDISGLKQLILAGRAYISDSLYSVPNSGTDGVPTVESVSVRSNQQMYLVDFSMLEFDHDKDGNYDGLTQNPFVLPSGSVDTDESPVLSRIRLKAGERVTGGSLTSRVYQYGGQTIVYCYMEFANPSAVNDYFEKYFAKNANKMNSYLVNKETGEDGTTTQTPITSNLNASSVYSLGYTIQGKDGAYTVSRPDGKINSAGMRSTFNQLITTLVDANTDPGEDDNPYDYIVNTSKLEQLGNGEVRKFTWKGKDKDGNDITVEGVVTKGDYVINDTAPEGTQSNLRLVIAGGNVTVEANYQGLIICGKTLDIQGTVNMSADDDGVMKAFDAVFVVDPADDTKNIKLREYLRDSVTGSNSGGDGSGSWNLDTLITYKNWTKS